MSFESVIVPVLILLLLVGLVSSYLAETDEHIYSSKERLTIAGDINSGVATMWLMSPFVVSYIDENLFFVVIISAVFYLLMWRCYRKARSVSS
jgi:ABC-type transport system involved in cytochrome c biogenesis permease subunit